MTEFTVDYDIGDDDDRELFRKHLASIGGIMLLKSCYAIESDVTAAELLEGFLEMGVFSEIGDDGLFINAIDDIDAAYFESGEDFEELKSSLISVDSITAGARQKWTEKYCINI